MQKNDRMLVMTMTVTAGAETHPPQLVRRALLAQAPASPEYDDVDVTGIIGGVSGSMARTLVAPKVNDFVAQQIDDDEDSWFASKYGSVIPSRISGLITGEVTGAISSVITDALRGVLHGRVQGVAEGKPGLGYTPPAPNQLVGQLANGVLSSWFNMAIRDAIAPPPPAVAAQPVASAAPASTNPAPEPAAPAAKEEVTVLGQPIAPIMRSAAMGLVNTGISALYQQTAAPLVQRTVNVLTGRADEEIRKPAPLTPGAVVNQFVGSVLGSLFVPSLSTDALGIHADSTGGSLGISMASAIVDAAWGAFYDRGIGNAITDTINGLAGLRSEEEKKKAKLPALEHFMRSASRGVAVGATTYGLGKMLAPSMIRLGAKVGGIGGALIAATGAALIGSIGGSIVDATVGPLLGRLGGAAYSWLTGKPSFEQRAADATETDAAEAPVDVDSDDDDEENTPSGVVRKRTGDAAVDKTSPAIDIDPSKLAEIAVNSVTL